MVFTPLLVSAWMMFGLLVAVLVPSVRTTLTGLATIGVWVWAGAAIMTITHALATIGVLKSLRTRMRYIWAGLFLVPVVLFWIPFALNLDPGISVLPVLAMPMLNLILCPLCVRSIEKFHGIKVEGL